jgi:DNA-binding NarL/FixJ family response regulator
LAEGGASGLEMLREAVRQLNGSPAELERARAEVDFGAALRRQGYLVTAREVLAGAMDLSHHLGAAVLVRRSADELRAAGARPRRFAQSGAEALTPAESRVAQLAREGRTNREIAQALFVTPKAVEYHLANTYQKLGISSRTELGATLPAQ